MYIGIAASIFDVLLCYFVLTKYNEGTQSHRFRILVFIITVSAFLEWIRPILGLLPYTPLNYLIKRLVQSLCYIGSTGVAFFFQNYLDSFLSSEKRIRAILRKANIGLYIVYCLILFLNTFTGWVASYDELSHVWTHGPLYIYVGYLFPAYYMTFCLLFFFKDIKKMERRVQETMFASIIVGGAGVIVQPFLHGAVRLTAFCTSIAIYLWYFAVENYDYHKLLEVTKKLKEAEKKALAANNAKSAFLANMSHEIRTPMNAVLGLDEMILRTDNKAEIDEYARNIQSSGRTLLAIINDILDFSKIESGKMQIINAPYKLTEVIQDVSRMIAMRAQKKDLKFETNFDPSLPNELNGDEVRVKQIMINILNNAIKYTESGSVSFNVSYIKDGDSLTNDKKEWNEGDSVSLFISIKDTGIGIKKEDLGSLFNSFERVDETRNRSIEGTGLGLSIVHSLINLMGGNIAVTSEYGKGSEFTVVLPQKVLGKGHIADSADDETEEKKDFITEHKIAPNANILLVDDNNVNLIVARGLLKYTKAHITTCTSGQECLRLMAEQKFDIIFLDHMMPELDGVETLNRTRNLENNKNKNTPIIALTANAMAGMREQYLVWGFTDYLSKPIDSNAMYAVLYKYISKDLIQSVDENDSSVANIIEEKPKVSAPKPITALVREPPAPCRSEVPEKEKHESSGAENVLVSDFCKNCLETKKRLIRFLMSEDWSGYRDVMHNLEEQSSRLALVQLSVAAQRLEKASGDVLNGVDAIDNIDFIHSYHTSFVHLYDESVGDLQNKTSYKSST